MKVGSNLQKACENRLSSRNPVEYPCKAHRRWNEERKQAELCGGKGSRVLRTSDDRIGSAWGVAWLSTDGWHYLWGKKSTLGSRGWTDKVGRWTKTREMVAITVCGYCRPIRVFSRDRVQTDTLFSNIAWFDLNGGKEAPRIQITGIQGYRLKNNNSMK